MLHIGVFCEGTKERTAEGRFREFVDSLRIQFESYTRATAETAGVRFTLLSSCGNNYFPDAIIYIDDASENMRESLHLCLRRVFPLAGRDSAGGAQQAIAEAVKKVGPVAFWREIGRLQEGYENLPGGE